MLGIKQISVVVPLLLGTSGWQTSLGPNNWATRHVVAESQESATVSRLEGSELECKLTKASKSTRLCKTTLWIVPCFNLNGDALPFELGGIAFRTRMQLDQGVEASLVEARDTVEVKTKEETKAAPDL